MPFCSFLIDSWLLPFIGYLRNAFLLLICSLPSVCVSLRVCAELSPCRSALPGSMPSRFSTTLFYSPAFLFLSELPYATHMQSISLPIRSKHRLAVSSNCHPSLCRFKTEPSNSFPLQFVHIVAIQPHCNAALLFSSPFQFHSMRIYA